jgi:hypothetical protein
VNTEIKATDTITARRLLSGDVLLTLQGEKERKKWEGSQEIIRAFRLNAQVKTREFTLLAYSIRVAIINMFNQSVRINKIYTQNLGLKDKV